MSDSDLRPVTKRNRPAVATASDPAGNEAFHRLTARLATLDLDAATLEILTAVLTADLDTRPLP
jgi:hypothetical protein